MQYSTRFSLNLPELGDQYNLEHWNKNTRKLDEIIPTSAEIKEYINNALSNFYTSKPYSARTPRWLRFGFTDSNHKSLVIAAGTSIVINGKPYEFTQDTPFDLSGGIVSGGTDYFVHAYVENNAVNLIATRSRTDSGKENSIYIGRFHTLCNAVDISTTMTMAASPSSGIAVGDKYLIKPYDENTDVDFFGFYNKSVIDITAGTYHDVVTMGHPLAGFRTGDILPESVWSISWSPSALTYDGMVYDKATDMAIDVYFQSGTGKNTASVYGAAHTVSRQQQNHADDMMQVGKMLISDEEFASAALGSNEKTAIVGASDKSTVGGHIDTNSRRMISAIGCEEMCGYLWQWLRDVSANGGSGFTTYDGSGQFGQTYGGSYALLAGGDWSPGASCGSRCRSAAYARSDTPAGIGGRGVCRVIRNS